MKNIIFLVLLIASMRLSAQTTPVTMLTEKTAYYTVEDDTVTIIKSDKIVSGSVFLTSEGDSCIINGCSKIISGISANGIVLKNTTANSYEFGSDYNVSDTLIIECYGKVFLSVLFKP